MLVLLAFWGMLSLLAIDKSAEAAVGKVSPGTWSIPESGLFS